MPCHCSFHGLMFSIREYWARGTEKEDCCLVPVVDLQLPDVIDTLDIVGATLAVMATKESQGSKLRYSLESESPSNSID